ncbi:ATPase [Candidatus Falkowbacteria bacterium CG_4_9_14_3_um_filter_36_9]|nr:MAG: ATPase [Candidatus Falkowbacteria bacterium CG_4_8_14_3_um_filter_36_11]PJA10714.1 MAG: ATPase [Candidatus Falkowbacteria bacterium CG_4_10_14_0_2_um_filter_36_22]PJB19382.1 MAG: ATPase [Candidatus Falkowbacteria bacterium CG_4_9_14_3_um_filter_36_9]
MPIDFHSLKAETCLKELKSSVNGLTEDEAQKRIKKYGYNELPKEKPLGKFSIFISQFKSPLIYILLIFGFISLWLREYTDMIVILGAVAINTIIGYFQESKANDALARLKRLVELKSIVWRDGKKIAIDSRQITIGDIIIIKSGNRIPADARLWEEENLSVNEASLTGESIPSEKNINIVKKGASIADRKNMVFAGTIAVKGLGKAVVTAIGQETEIGKIAEMVKSAKEEKTPLQLRLGRFSNLLAIIFSLISIFVAVIGIFQKRSILEMIKIGISLAVSSIPEGLIVAITFILVMGMKRILKKKALTRKLVAAETLGSTTVICTDKTGTLTIGEMHVAHIIIGEKEFEIKTPGSRQEMVEAKAVSLALQTAMMVNEASIENPNDELGNWRIIGEPTEAALLSAAIQSGLNKEKLLQIEPKINELPFTSELKYMISLHKNISDLKEKNNLYKYILYEKGAPEIILGKSIKFFHQGRIINIAEEDRDKLNDSYKNLTNKGLRVIAVATREFKNLNELGFKDENEAYQLRGDDWNKIDNNLTFIGFIALKDPLRPEAKETIKICQEAGIKLIIITGDHQLTAKAIAEEAGIKVKSENIITGEYLDKIDDKELEQKVKKIEIYARVSPHHKLRIVRALQARGEVVAMTGDGINDSPALKQADIGISLGAGTDIAKEASDIVLLDNNFKTIVSAIYEGRIIFNNIRKVITYLISDSFSEVIIIIGSILMGAPLALIPVQILWINIINDGLPNFSLAFEKGDDNIMRKKPMKKHEPILNTEMKTIIFSVSIMRDLFVLVIFYVLIKLSYDINYIRTLIFAIIGIKSLMYIFSLRSLEKPIWKINPFSNAYLLISVFTSFLLLIAAIYLPLLQNILSTASLGFYSWMIILSAGIINIIMIEAVKYFFAHRPIKDIQPASLI